MFFSLLRYYFDMNSSFYVKHEVDKLGFLVQLRSVTETDLKQMRAKLVSVLVIVLWIKVSYFQI